MLNALRTATVRPMIPFPNAIPVLPSSSPTNASSPVLLQHLQRKSDAFFKLGNHKTISGPMNPDRFPHWNVTPKYEMGINRTAYDINGELMVAQTSVVPGAQPTWYDLGKMPR
jgi:hypothetical protein